ncbi:MAG: ribose 5-phosphate isomerase B [Candidatus Omnitrophica bacterium]|nr:ribose 5-phosphate isomerase B [Candidatus Omnitrophota bacterium]
MKIAIGSDHRGYPLKQELIAFLKEKGHEVTDLGTDSTDSCDYPLYSFAVARAVSNGAAECGIVVCNTGIGVSMVANKIRGVRAALCYETAAASTARRHNNANVLALGAGYLTARTAKEITQAFLTGQFEGGRHKRRVDQISDIENQTEDNRL